MRVCVFGFGWMVVWFVRVFRLPACARVSRVSRVCPGSGESRESTFVQRERGGGANLGMRAPRFANHR